MVLEEYEDLPMDRQPFLCYVPFQGQILISIYGKMQGKRKNEAGRWRGRKRLILMTNFGSLDLEFTVSEFRSWTPQ